MSKVAIDKTVFKRLAYHAKHYLFVPKNLALVIATVIATVWVFSALSAMQDNFELQRELDAKRQQLALVQLEVDNLSYESDYYTTKEYQELAVRDRLGLASPGEKVLVLGEYSDWVREKNQSIRSQVQPLSRPSNFKQWLNFLFGAENA